MGDDEEGEFKITYSEIEGKVLGEEDEDPREFNWIKFAGKGLVEYANGESYDGYFNSEKMKHGEGTYIWMKENEEGEKEEKAKYVGGYADGLKSGIGKMVFPNGDIYEGEWKENKMEGQGLYRYKKTNDVYDGLWAGGLKQGAGAYEFGEDKSRLIGTWDKGEFVTGEWVYKGAGSYTGTFAKGQPIGPGKFAFPSGISQSGTYAVKGAPAEGEEAEEEEGETKEPSWIGEPVFNTVAA